MSSLTWFKKEVKNTFELCQPKVDIKKMGKRYAEWHRPEDKPTPIIWFTVFVVGLFLNVFSISVSASELCTSTACVIFYVVNGFGMLFYAVGGQNVFFIGGSGVHLTRSGLL